MKKSMVGLFSSKMLHAIHSSLKMNLITAYSKEGEIELKKNSNSC